MSEETIPVNSIDAAEKIILENINNGKNYRDIAQITFSINGTIKRFNPSQISQIKAKSEENQAQSRRDPDKALAFKLLKSGTSPTDVLIKTGLPSEFVKEANEEFLDFEDQTTVYNEWIDNLHDISLKIRRPTDPNRLVDIALAFERAKDSHLELENYVCSCSVCGESMRISDEMLEDAKKYLSSKWRHGNCS